MNRLLTLVVAIMVCCGSAIAQELPVLTPPNYDQIKKATKNKTSEYYYPKLMSRYKANDTTLSLKEMHMLYYGQLFEKGMRAAANSSPAEDSARAIRKKGELTKTDRQRLAGFYATALEDEPMGMGLLISLFIQYQELEDPRIVYCTYKINTLMGVIMETGNGVTDTSAMHIAAVNDEYAVLDLLGFEYGGSQSVLKTGCDYLTLAENEYGLEGLYFDVKQLLMSK